MAEDVSPASFEPFVDWRLHRKGDGQFVIEQYEVTGIDALGFALTGMAAQWSCPLNMDKLVTLAKLVRATHGIQEFVGLKLPSVVDALRFAIRIEGWIDTFFRVPQESSRVLAPDPTWLDGIDRSEDYEQARDKREDA